MRRQIVSFQRAVGMELPAVKIVQDKGAPVIVPYVEHHLPDPGAAMNWLVNRRGDKWRKNGGGEAAEPLIIEGETRERSDEIARRMAAMLADARRAAGIRGGWTDENGQVNLNVPPPRNRQATDVTPQAELGASELQRLVREAIERKARESGGE
jgi:hypothetical protein